MHLLQLHPHAADPFLPDAALRWRRLVRLLRTGCLLPLSMALTCGAWSQEPFSAELRQFLIGRLAFASDELDRAERGEAVIREVPGLVEKELGIAGLVWIDGDPARYVEAHTRGNPGGKSAAIPESGSFSAVATVDDLRALQLDECDLESLRSCRTGDCGVKLFGREIRATAGIGQSAPLNETESQDRFRQMLLRVLTAYRLQGGESLGEYVDQPDAVSAQGEFLQILSRAAELRAAAPRLEQRLRGIPRSSDTDSGELFVWQKSVFGLKPTVRLKHVLVHRSEAQPGIPWVVAAKQIYASHYFQAALELEYILQPQVNRSGGGFYLLIVNRSRNDGLEGFWKGILRTMVRTKVRDGMARYLAYTRERMQLVLEAREVAGPERRNRGQ